MGYGRTDGRPLLYRIYMDAWMNLKSKFSIDDSGVEYSNDYCWVGGRLHRISKDTWSHLSHHKL